MRSLVLIFTFATLIISVCSKPYYCNNWCYGQGTVACCDYGQNIDINPFIVKTYCPIENCTLISTSARVLCNNDDDCKRKETCCENPCFAGRKMCTVHVDKNPVEMGCKVVTNCDDWNKANTSPVICKSDDDCKRSETCCTNPCHSQKVCQKTEMSSGTGTTITGTDTRVISGSWNSGCPYSNYCY